MWLRYRLVSSFGDTSQGLGSEWKRRTDRRIASLTMPSVWLPRKGKSLIQEDAGEGTQK